MHVRPCVCVRACVCVRVLGDDGPLKIMTYHMSRLPSGNKVLLSQLLLLTPWPQNDRCTQCRSYALVFDLGSFCVGVFYETIEY